MTSVFIKRGDLTVEASIERKQCEEKQEDPSISQGEGPEQTPLYSSYRTDPADTQILGICPLELGDRFLLLKPLSFWYFEQP